MALVGQRSLLPTADGAMGIYEVLPAAAADRALIVLHGAFGANAHAEKLARRFTAYGYRTLLPNLYHRTTATALQRSESVDVEAIGVAVRQHLKGLSSDTFTEDLAQAITHLERNGVDRSRIGVVGFCLGGSGAFLASVRFRLGATVSFYGLVGAAVEHLQFAVSPIDMAPDLQAPYLGIFADLDPLSPVDELEVFRAALTKAAVPGEILRYADAVHGFHDDDLPELYQPEFAKDAERRAFEWFDRYIPA